MQYDSLPFDTCVSKCQCVGDVAGTYLNFLESQNMKRHLALAVLASLAALSNNAMAGNVAAGFTVSSTLTSVCKSTTSTSSPPDVTFGAYTAFQTSDIIKTANVTFACTRNLAVTGAAIDGTADGNLNGVRYTLAVDGGTKTAGAAASSSSGASADTYVYVITGTMLAGQAGDTTVHTQDTRTLTISF